MSPREQKILELLDDFDNLVNPLLQGGQEGSTGVMLMPATYTDSVRELERLMGCMRRERRDLWWHVNARYGASRQVIHELPVRRKGKHGKHVTVLERTVVRVGDLSVDADVERGVEWLANAWSLKHEPMVPELVV